MHVYKGDSLRNRMRLDPKLGYWLDYWLFLHSEETHPVWCVRPLGLKLISETALQTTSSHDYTLREQIAREAEAAARITPFLSGIPPMPICSPTGHRGWDKEWLRWFEAALRAGQFGSIARDLISAIAQALDQTDYTTANFLTRWLAAELAEAEWSQSELSISVRGSLCDSGKFAEREFDIERFLESLNTVLGEKPKFHFIVTLPVAPVFLSRTVARKFYRGPRLLLEASKDNRQVLTGIEIELDASHVDEAAALGTETARTLLEDLRLVFYIRTHLCGSVRVTRTDPPLNCHRSLPQPFWKKAAGRREVPRLPQKCKQLVSMLSEEERLRWNAAQWHLSQALSDWAEDSHTAASHVWQALEAFSGSSEGGWRNVLFLIPEYLDYAVADMGKHLATRLSLQAQEIRALPQSCDWYKWDSKRIVFQKWLGRVLDARSFNCYGRWSLPIAPALLFDGNIGLLQIISRRIGLKGCETWMEKRIESDLTLLYGLRNRAVHSGQRILGRAAAMSLGQTGAEVLLAVMGRMAEKVRRGDKGTSYIPPVKQFARSL